MAKTIEVIPTLNPYLHITKLEVHEGSAVQKQIRKALLEILERKPLTDISVKELCAKAYIARSTFYSYYQNIDEVLCEIENETVQHLTSLNEKIIDHSLIDPEDLTFYQETIQYVKDNRQKFYLFLIGQPNSRFIDKWKQAIKYHLWERIFRENVAKNAELILEMTASLIIAGYTFCLKNPYNISPSEMCDMVSHILQSLEYEM